MSATMLKVTMIGNLGRDPEMRYTPSGTPVTSFSVAATRTWNNAQGEKQTETTWVKATSWGKQAETCSQYLKKGAKVYIEGRLIPDKNGNPRIWQGDDGVSHAGFEVNCSEVLFLSPKGEGGEEAQSMGAPGETEEIPF